MGQYLAEYRFKGGIETIEPIEAYCYEFAASNAKRKAKKLLLNQGLELQDLLIGIPAKARVKFFTEAEPHSWIDFNGLQPGDEVDGYFYPESRQFICKRNGVDVPLYVGKTCEVILSQF